MPRPMKSIGKFWDRTLLFVIAAGLLAASLTANNEGAESPHPTSSHFSRTYLAEKAIPQRIDVLDDSNTNDTAGLIIEAEHGDCLAQVNLAIRYEEGRGVSRSLTNAIYWYEKAASQNHGLASFAQFQLGWIHDTQTKDYAQAAKWYRKAAEG